MPNLNFAEALYKIAGKLLKMGRLNRLGLESVNSYIRSSGRAAEGDGLENRCTERYRGFESLLLRLTNVKNVIAGTFHAATHFAAVKVRCKHISTSESVEL